MAKIVGALADIAERDCRPDERLWFSIDIGAGGNKICGLGCDIRKVTDIQCDARHLPFPDKAFILGVLRHCLEHISDWPLALEEAKRVAHVLIVFHPKSETWHLDPEHIPCFTLPEGTYLRSFAYSDCYVIGCSR